MRVLVTAEQLRRPVPGGIGTYLRGLLQGVARLRSGSDGTAPPFDLTLLASRGPHGADPLAAFGLPLVVLPWPAPVLTRGWDHGLFPAPPGFDVLHHGSLAAAPSRGTPVVATIHDLAWRHVPEAYPRRGRRWHEAALRRALHGSDRFIVPSGLVAEDLVAAGAPASRVRVAGAGADHLPAPDRPATSALLDRLGVDGPFLLAVGTLEPRKNLARLFAAYEKVRPALPERWPLLVVGPSGWGEQAIPPPGVVAVGRVDDPVLAGLYESARLLAYVPLSEGFGLPPVEAMAAGLPTVCSPLPSTGGASLEVDPYDVGGIAEALLALAVDDDLRAERTAAGRAWAAKMTWAEIARRHVAVWEEVA